MAKKIPVEIGILVAAVFDPGKRRLEGVLRQLTPCEPKQRPRQKTRAEGSRRRHSSQAAGAAAAKQLQQQGLRLVVLVMGGKQHVARTHHACERPVTRFPRHRFQTLPPGLLRLHFQPRQRNPLAPAVAFAMPDPALRIRLQAMVDMNCP